jgi:hypothetical protein
MMIAGPSTAASGDAVDGYLGSLGAGRLCKGSALGGAAHLPARRRGCGFFGQYDLAPVNVPVWRSKATAGTCLEATLKNLAIIASQPFYLMKRPARPLLEEMRAHFVPLDALWPLSGKAASLARAFRTRIFADLRAEADAA